MHKIALFFGGDSPEYEISLRSAACVLRHLPRERYEVLAIGITRAGGFLLTDADPHRIETDAWQAGGRPVFLSHDPTRRGLFWQEDGKICHALPDLLLPVLHGGYGEGGEMQGLFALSGIPFAGCDTEAAVLCMDKVLTKTLLAPLMPTLPHICLLPEAQSEDEAVREIEAAFAYPVFIKPTHGGSSVGAGCANGREELHLRLEKAGFGRMAVMAEPCVKAREIELAVLAHGGDIEVSSPGEIRVADGFYSYEEKYGANSSARLFDRAELPEETVLRLQGYARTAYRRLGCRGGVRVDFFLTEPQGEIYLNEINSLPGFTEISMFPRLMTATRSLSDLLCLLVSEALST